MQVVAAVLEKTPSPVNSVRPDVPPALAVVLAHCLAKQRDGRFPNHAELRAALLPFSSDAPMPARLVPRFAAYMADSVMLQAVVVLAAWALRLPIKLLFGFRRNASDTRTQFTYFL